jgi:septal ring factor EnvC (AmiA/AmiB activator)
MKVYGKKVLFLIALVLGIFFLGRASLIFADDCDNISSDASSIGDKITCLNNKVTSLFSQASTLKNQIAQFDAQIRLTTLKISQTQNQIDLLGGRIDQLEVSLNDLTKAFSSRAVETYKLSRFENNFFFILSATDINDATQRFHYLKKIEEEDRSLLKKLTEAQTTYKGEKQDQETLQKQLTTQQANLNSQKAAKARLLSDTQNSEARYQALLAEAQAEYLAIQGILAGNGQETEVGHVNQGEKIASIIQGSSCNSSGSHLHFTVSQDGTAQNPFNYLKSGIDFENCSGSSCGSSDGDSFNPSGSWDWPINPRIEFYQGFGSTWATRNTYVGRIYSAHNGIDINNDSSDEIHSVRAGTLFRGSYAGGGGCSLRYVRIHNDDGGLDILYLHVNYIL